MVAKKVDEKSKSLFGATPDMNGGVASLGSLRCAFSDHGVGPYGLAGSGRSGHHTTAHLSGFNK